MKDFDRAIELDPGYADAYWGRGVVYSMRGEEARAIIEFNQAVDAYPRHTWALYNRGRSFSRLTYQGKAIEDFDRVIALDPNNAQAYGLRGSAYAALAAAVKSSQYWRRAIEDYTRAIELDPTSGELHSARAEAYQAVGETELASQDSKESTKLTPNQLLSHLKSIGITLRLEDGKLKMKGAIKHLTPDLRDALDRHKLGLAKLLKGSSL